jgi:hypothetical protein
MKKISFIFFPLLIASLFIGSCETSQTDLTQPVDQQSTLSKSSVDAGCITIQSGTLLTSDGEVIKTGYDKWGYNYQAHMFNGTYCDAYRDAAWCQEYKDVNLIMKWNDAWLSNQDCDGDGKLDRHLGFPTYRGSGAWTTNHMSGTYLIDGKKCKWTYFVKIVAVPLDANKISGIWYNSAGTEIGPDIWGEFAVVQEISNDPCAGIHGLQYVSPDHPGLGGW